MGTGERPRTLRPKHDLDFGPRADFLSDLKVNFFGGRSSMPQTVEMGTVFFPMVVCVTVVKIYS